MQASFIHFDSNGDDIVTFPYNDHEQKTEYEKYICHKVGVEYGTPEMWDEYEQETGVDYFKDVFSKKMYCVVVFPTSQSNVIMLHDNVKDALDSLDYVEAFNDLQHDVDHFGVYTFKTIKNAFRYIKDLKES